MDVRNKAIGFMGIGAEGQRCGISVDRGSVYYGEHNAVNRPHGKCIKFDSNGWINIRYYKDGVGTVGNFICIYRDGWIYVGECYADSSGAILNKGTRYNTDGTS